MSIFIAGICGTFMAGIAQLARQSGIAVSGCDENVYPPMSTLLQNQNIDIHNGYSEHHINKDVDQIVIGNALSRGNPLVEHVLNERKSYCSGPQWLSDHVLQGKTVYAVAGTHGKTTTASILNWILHACGTDAGYLIGGQPGNFTSSAELGNSDHFVIEADEYDTAFFDKRSKFVHYKPTVVILNNLEFDHADIFETLDDIKRQFHHLVRIIPQQGAIIANDDDENISEVLEMGCWTTVDSFSIAASSKAKWKAQEATQDCSTFDILQNQEIVGRVKWHCYGQHNMSNALAAIIAATKAGIDIQDACHALGQFIPTKRRLELRFKNQDLHLYEDFAHHPSAIAITLETLRRMHPNGRLITILEARSNTMKMGTHGNQVELALNNTDKAILYKSSDSIRTNAHFHHENDIESVLRLVMEDLRQEDIIVLMSNGGFDNLPDQLQHQLETYFLS